MEQVEAWSK
jgi:hypothetical protein